MSTPGTITIPARDIPVVHDADICVVGGSCTGVFAAVRAARLGAKVAIVEKQNCFGGVATAGLVNIWHSLYDEPGEKQIIAGLTEHAIQPFLHNMFAGPIVVDGILEGIAIQTMSGQAAITARQFVDATGDGFLARSLGCAALDPGSFQPPTRCAKIYGMQSLGDWDWNKAVKERGDEVGLEPDWGWSTLIPGLPGLEMRADSHVFGLDTTQPDMLTASEIEGRRKVRAILDIMREYGPAHSQVSLADLPAAIGIRESRRVRGIYGVTGEDVLRGREFDDAIAYGSTRVDIHHNEGPGITWRFLDGREIVVPERGAEELHRRWREKTAEKPTYYQVPLRSLIQEKVPDLMLAGRMLDADKEAFSAIRVMINMNQTGEAAGVAAYIALTRNVSVQEILAGDVRLSLQDGGSLIV